MDLIDKINQDLKEAMKSKNADRLNAIRAIKAELLLIKTKDGSETISEEAGLRAVQKLVNQRKESANIFKQQNRLDLAEKELAELLFIETYLPKQLTDEELTLVVKEIISRVGAASPKDMGKVMGVATKELTGKAEGKLIAEKVKNLLATT